MGLKPRPVRAPSPVLAVADHVLLRPPSQGDTPELFQLVDADRSHLERWMPWPDAIRTIPDIARFIADTDRVRQLGSALRLVLQVRGELAGIVSLENIAPAHRTGAIGYWIGARHQGNGLVTRAVKRLCDHAFGPLGLHLIEIRAAPDNRRSRAVPERLGFHLDGILRQREQLASGYVDHAVYSMLAEEWSATPRESDSHVGNRAFAPRNSTSTE